MQEGEGEEHVSVPAVISLLSKKHEQIAGSNHKKDFLSSSSSTSITAVASSKCNVCPIVAHPITEFYNRPKKNNSPKQLCNETCFLWLALKEEKNQKTQNQTGHMKMEWA